MTIEQKTELVKQDILSLFPDARYTIRILLWDDGTDSIECKHGRQEGDKFYSYTSTYYDGHLKRSKIELRKGASMMIDEMGNQYLKM